MRFEVSEVERDIDIVEGQIALAKSLNCGHVKVPVDRLQRLIESAPKPSDKYAEYERAWRDHCERINSERFGAGMFPARFSSRDKADFIQTLALIDAQKTP